jgi:uncharacterized protein
VAALAAGLLAACGSGSAAVKPMAQPVPSGQIRGLAPAKPPFASFEQVEVTIVSADGTTRTPCMLVARTGSSRDRGLMDVTDPKLAGYAGMVFAFDTDVTGTFWMRDTLIPLSVVFLDRSGDRISSADMTPCPTTTADCPLYPASAPYRWAIEVPAGGLAGLGLAPADRPRVTVGGACRT